MILSLLCCSLACLIINWDFAHQNSSIEYDSKTIEFEKVLIKWRRCVERYNDKAIESNKTICEQCEADFEGLFTYYWKIYKEPGIDFCVDVETTVS